MTLATDFWVHHKRIRQGARLVWDGGPDDGATLAYWVSAGDGKATWLQPDGVSTGTERWITRDDWLMIEGYDQWDLIPLKTEYTDLNSGESFTLPAHAGLKAHHYLPAILPRDPWRIDSHELIGGSLYVYWMAEFYYGRVLNKKWFEGPQERDCVIQRELWWDSGCGGPNKDGWVRAKAPAGQTPIRPFDANNKPQRTNMLPAYKCAIALGAGAGWTAHDEVTDTHTALYSLWTW